MPMFIRLTCLIVADRMCLALIGNYDPSPEHVGGSALAKMYYNVFGMSIGKGLGLGIGTFCSRNHGRGKNSENGVVFWQGMKAYAVGLVISFVMIGGAGSVLRSLHQPEALIWPCHLFAMVQTIGLPASEVKEAIVGTLVAQRVSLPGTVVDITGSALQFALSYALLEAGVGYIAVAIATAVSKWVAMAILVTYVLRSDKQCDVWTVPEIVSSEGQVSFRSYLATALPAGFSLWAEFWALEIFQVIAGLMGIYAASACGVFSSTLTIFYVTFVSIQVAASVRIGNLVGEKDYVAIPRAVDVNVLAALAMSALVSGILHVFGAKVMRLYTTNEHILAEAISANPGLVLSIPPYAVMMCFMGVLRPAHRQLTATGCLAISFYMVGIPVGAFLGLEAGGGLLGLWFGNVIALGCSALGLLVVTRRVNWPAVCGINAEREDSGCDSNLGAPLVK